MNVKIQMPKDVKNIIRIIKENGGNAHIVGGCVRDYFLGKEPKDIDITTSLPPELTLSIFRNLGYNVIPTGLKHGTVTVMMNSVGYEITTYRIDGEYSDGRHPDSVEFTDRIEDDLARRDLKFNAMAYNDEDGLIDLFGGVSDLNNGIICTVGNPVDRMTEDPLRMLRAPRFAAQLSTKNKKYVLDPVLFEVIKDKASSILLISGERIHAEIEKIMTSDNPEMIMLLYDTGLLKYIMPELNRCFSVQQNNPWHIYDVGRHTIEVVKNTNNDIILRFAALLHDIGKARAKTTDADGIDHFSGHPEISYNMAIEILSRLKFSNDESSKILKLIRLHDASPIPTAASVRKFVSKHTLNEEAFMRLLDLQIADCKGQNLELSQEKIEEIEKIREIYKEQKDAPVKISDLKLNGNDLINMGFKPGKTIGTVLKTLLELVLEDPAKNNFDDLKNIVISREWQ